MTCARCRRPAECSRRGTCLDAYDLGYGLAGVLEKIDASRGRPVTITPFEQRQVAAAIRIVGRVYGEGEQGYA